MSELLKCCIEWRSSYVYTDRFFYFGKYLQTQEDLSFNLSLTLHINGFLSIVISEMYWESLEICHTSLNIWRKRTWAALSTWISKTKKGYLFYMNVFWAGCHSVFRINFCHLGVVSNSFQFLNVRLSGMRFLQWFLSVRYIMLSFIR